MIAGLDPSTRALAFVGCTERNGQSWHERIDLLKPGQHYDAELAGDIFAATYEVVVARQIDTLYVEAPLVGRGGVRTAVVLGYVSGAIHAGATYGGAVVQIVYVQSWKKHVVGNGNATKDMVTKAVRHQWPVMYRAIAGDQDLVDAAAICLHGVHQHRVSVMA